MHPINVTNKPSNPISPTPSCAGLSRASTSCTPQEDIPSLLQSDETLAAAEQWAQGTAHDRFAVAPQVLFIQLTRRRDQQLSNAAARSFCENGHYGKARSSDLRGRYCRLYSCLLAHAQRSLPDPGGAQWLASLKRQSRRCAWPRSRRGRADEHCHLSARGEHRSSRNDSFGLGWRAGSAGRYRSAAIVYCAQRYGDCAWRPRTNSA